MSYWPLIIIGIVLIVVGLACQGVCMDSRDD